MPSYVSDAFEMSLLRSFYCTRIVGTIPHQGKKDPPNGLIAPVRQCSDFAQLTRGHRYSSFLSGALVPVPLTSSRHISLASSVL
jgi:hypothetical protein